MYSVLENSQGALSIGNWGGGLNRFDRRTGHFEPFRFAADDPHSLSSDLVTALHETKGRPVDRHVWRRPEPLRPEDAGQFIRYENLPADPDSLSFNNIKAIGEDRAGNLWIGTEGGGE